MSTYSQTRAVGNVANDAGFRVWGKFLSDSFESGGWLKTADTGQVDWTTVARPAINTAAGYEIRKSPTQSGYTDFYLKIEYGSGSNVAYPAIWFTVGTGSDGAGTLTGTVSTRYQRGISTNTGQVEDLVCALDNSLTFLWCVTTGTPNAAGGFICFERYTDADGNYETDGLTVQSHGNNAVHAYSMTSASVLATTTDLPVGYFPPSYSGTAGTVFVAPAMGDRPDAHYPMRAVCYMGVSNAAATTYSFAMFPGKTQTWRGNEMAIVSAALMITTPESVCPVIRWE